MLKSLLPILFVAMAAPAVAQDDADWRFGDDAFMAGRTVTLSGDGVDDLFAAGYKVTARSEVGGSAHMAGRYVTLDARVGENFYGAGMEVDVDGPVAGDVTVLGESLSVTEPVSDQVMLDAEITGDVALAAANVDWGDAASVAGTLHVYSDDPDDIDVPERVAPADRVERHEMRDFEGMDGMPGAERPGFFARLQGWVGSVVVIGLLGTLFAAVAPDYVAKLRERALARPLRTGWIGFLGLSVLVGSVLFLAMTGIGVLLIPVSLIAAVVLAITGYVVGTYVLGVWATGMAGRGMPDSTGDRAIAAFAGAAIGALIGLIPFLGWLAVMAIFLVGAGALVVRMFAPGFQIEEV